MQGTMAMVIDGAGSQRCQRLSTCGWQNKDSTRHFVLADCSLPLSSSKVEVYQMKFRPKGVSVEGGFVTHRNSVEELARVINVSDLLFI